MVEANPTALLNVEHLSVSFENSAGTVSAVKDLTFAIAPGEIVAIVGESGSGKSTAALAILRLLEENARIGGKVFFKESNLLEFSDNEMRRIRGKDIGMIFQDPFSFLNPVKSIGWQIGEILRVHEQGSRSAINTRILELLTLVGIRDPKAAAQMYPHQFSGGMRQRAMIAMAIGCGPSLLIADEPTTALDVTVQEKIVELLLDLRKKLSMAVLIITHNLGVVARLADKVVVLYGGDAVEQAKVDDLFAAPQHSYTKSLLSAVPTIAHAPGHLTQKSQGRRQ